MDHTPLSPFKPVSVRHDYHHLVFLQRVNQARSCSGFIGELETLVTNKQGQSVIGNGKSFDPGVLPINDTNLGSEDSQKRTEVAYLCRIFSILGFSDNISDTMTFRLNEETVLTTPFGILWNRLQASNLMKVRRDGQSLGADTPHGYNAIIHQLNSSILFSLPEFCFVAFLCSPVFVSLSIDSLPSSLPELGEISVLHKNGFGGLDLDPTAVMSLMSYSNRILFIRGVGVIVCSKNVDNLLFSVKKLFQLSQNLHKTPMVDYSFKDWRNLFAGLAEKLSNPRINCHSAVRIPPVMFPSDPESQITPNPPWESRNHFIPTGTSLDEYLQVYEKIRGPKANSVSENLENVKNGGDEDHKTRKESRGLLSRLSFRWPFNKD